MSTQPVVFEDSAAAESERVQKLDAKPEPATFAAVALQSITGPVRDRRTILLDDLNNLRVTIASLDQQLAGARDLEETKKIELLQLDEFLQKCEGISSLSRELEPYIKSRPATPTLKTRTMTECDFTSADCLKVFEDHPNINLNASELLHHTPMAKREAARLTYNARITYLCEQGKIVRISQGVYRLTGAEAPAEPVVEQAMPQATQQNVAAIAAVKPAYVPEDPYAERLDAVVPLRSKTVTLEAPRGRGRPKGSQNTALSAGLLPHLRGPVIVNKPQHG